MGDRAHLSTIFDALAELANADGDAVRAATLYGHAGRLRAETGYALRDPATREDALASTRASIGDSVAFERALAAGAAMSTDAAIALALAMP